LHDHHNRIQHINSKLVICGFTHHIFYIHQAAIIQLPPLQLVHESLATAKYFPSACRLCPHTDITTSQHTTWALRTYIKGIIRHSYNTLIPMRIYIKSPYVDHTLRIIPGIRGRLIPHIECQEYKMNITNHIQSSHSRRYKRIFELSVQNILYICSLLQIFCQMHLLIKSVILINPCKSICQKRVEI
jgi:hypothetical protein